MREAPGFEEWMAGERERLRGTAARVGWTLAWDQLQRGALPEAEHTGRRALGLNGIGEREVLRFIRALADAGDRAGAVAFYDRFIRHLREDLDLEPSEEGRSTLARIRAGVPTAETGPSSRLLTPDRYTRPDPHPGSGACSPPPAG